MKSFPVVVGVLIGAVAGYTVRGSMTQGPLGTPSRAPSIAQAAPAAPAAPRPPPPAAVYKAAIGDAPVKGDPEAKVTIVEFSDFQCPYCGQVIGTLDQLEKQYGRDVRFVFKHNPLPMHPDAPFAARAAIAAGKQGKFWEMHDKLFAANNSHEQGALSQEKVVEMARALGLDVARFKADAASPEAAARVDADQAQAQKLGAYGTPSFFINGARIAGAQPLESFKVLIDAQRKRADELLARGTAPAALYDKLIEDGIAEQPLPPPPQPPAAVVRDVDPGEGPSRGGKRPKVTIVEFSDFQCPYCSRAIPTLDAIQKAYKDDVRLVFRNEPLPMHENAVSAARAAMAAARQGKFWQMHDLMFAHQQDLTEARYEEWARQIGLDVARWKKDKDSPEVAAQVEDDARYARQVGADGTPTFFINGKMIPGALPFEAFKPVIDEQIARADAALKRGVKPDKLYSALVAENLAGGKAAQR